MIVYDTGCIDGDFELMQDEERNAIVGPVRYCWDGQWRSLCRRQNHNWDSNEAIVGCRQLGYQGETINDYNNYNS